MINEAIRLGRFFASIYADESSNGIGLEIGYLFMHEEDAEVLRITFQLAQFIFSIGYVLRE